MRYRRQIIRKINVLSKQFFVKLYDDLIKTLKFTKIFFNFKFSRENSKNSFLFELFVFKTNRFRLIIFDFVFSNFKFRNEQKKNDNH